MKFTLATLAAAAFLPMIEAHLQLVNPGVYKQGDPLPPLAEDGSNFPCAVTDFGSSDGEGPTLNPGQGAEILLKGTAVHGGGSCQVSITYDQPPNKNSVWKVMKSWQGACPIEAAGNLVVPAGGPLANSLPPLGYTLPAGLPSGKATIAWTWFNKVGNREMYMRCHKATIGGSGGDKGSFSSLPNMFVAQIAITTCRVPEGVNVRFPNPGSQVQGSGDGDPTGDCGPTGKSAPPQKKDITSPPKQKGAATEPKQKDPAQKPKQKGPDQKPKQKGGACKDGRTKCGGGSWSTCANGVWVNMGKLAPGTDCSSVGKRSIRFSAAHMVKRAMI